MPLLNATLIPLPSSRHDKLLIIIIIIIIIIKTIIDTNIDTTIIIIIILLLLSLLLDGIDNKGKQYQNVHDMRRSMH